MSATAPVQHLFVYGSLAPGQSNAHVLADVDGTWRPGHVRGTLHAEGWGAAMGYPGLVPGVDGDEIRGLVFSSASLDDEWPRLDAFEGDGYVRVAVPVMLDDGGVIEAHVYAIASASTPPG